MLPSHPALFHSSGVAAKREPLLRGFYDRRRADDFALVGCPSRFLASVHSLRFESRIHDVMRVGEMAGQSCESLIGHRAVRARVRFHVGTLRIHDDPELREQEWESVVSHVSPVSSLPVVTVAVVELLELLT